MALRERKIKPISLVDQLGRELTCQFCLGTVDDPRMLECLHSYCKMCIASLEIKNMPSMYKCPDCQETFTIPDIDKLPVHKIAVTKKRDLLLLRRISGDSVKCDLCPVPKKQAATAIYICLDCRDGQQCLCHNCSGSHYNKPELKDHQLELLQSLVTTSSGAGNRRTMMRRISVFSDVCSTHGLQLRYYCDSCKASICNDCKSESHCGHTVNSTATAVEDVKQIIPTELLYVIGIRDGLEQSMEPIQNAKAKIESQKDFLDNEIHSRVSQILRALEHEKKILQGQLASSVEAKLDMLSRQIREINKLVEKADQLAGMLADVESLSYQSDILSVTHTLLDKVDALKKEYNAAILMSNMSRATTPAKIATLKHQVSLTPCEEPNLGVMLNADLIKRELREASRIFTTTACPSRCSAIGPALKNPEAMKLTYFHIYIKDREGIACVSLQNVQVSIIIEEKNRQVLEIPKISHRGGGKYTVSFCPRKSGSCTIDVLVNQMHINHSPFKTSVIAPSSLAAEKSRKFESIDGVTIPVGLTRDGNGNILITNKSDKSKILALSDEANEVFRIEDEQNMLRDPCGITTDLHGNIYVTSSFYHCVLKYSSNTEFIKRAGRIGRTKGNFQNPAGICSHDEEIFVCDSSNCRVVIFNEQLEYKREICTELIGIHKVLSEPSYPYDIAFDAIGCMFISDTVNDCILVFKDGIFSSVIHFVGEGLNRVLQVPKGVTINNNGYLFVSDSGEIH